MLTSCSLKEAVENDFEHSTDVKPIAQAQTLAERYGNGRSLKVSVKIPLTEDSVGYYDLDEVLGDSELNAYQHSFVKRLKNRAKRFLYDFMVRIGFYDNLKFSTVFEFPKIDRRFVKKARVKRVFFTSEDCRVDERECNDRSKRNSNFNLIDRFFVNISPAKPSQAADDETEMDNIGSYEFYKRSRAAFAQDPKKVGDRISAYLEKKKILRTKGQKAPEFEMNIVSYQNNIPHINLNLLQVPTGERFLTLHHKKGTKQLRNFLRRKEFLDIIHSAKKTKDGVDIELKEGKTAQDLAKRVDTFNQQKRSTIAILRLNDKFHEAKKYFKQYKYKEIVKDTTLIGKSLYIELNDSSGMKTFEQFYKRDQRYIENHLDVYVKEKCGRNNCLDLEVTDMNLVPLLIESPKINLDTYLSIQSIGRTDFKYNGFIEVEVELDLPI